MDPQTQFCHNPQCRARGQIGQGTMQVHSRRHRRYRCRVCGQTASATKDTPFYRRRTPAGLGTQVLTLLSHGCPVPAIAAAFGLDERTVADWALRAGKHAQQLHAHLVQQERLDLPQVQADELWVKLVGRTVWLALALAVPSLRQPAPPGAAQQWHARTPAMAAGLTDHVWRMDELLHSQIPLPTWVAPKKRGRPRKAALPTGQTHAA